MLLGSTISYAQQYKFRDFNLPVEERVENLVSLLTIDEKLGQMVNAAPAIERLGIPAYNWWNECLHGVARSSYNTTSFPQAIAMAATWDTASIRTMADYAATEGRAIYNDASKKNKVGIYSGLTYWSPNINIFRDPRWGRGQETYGEDPFLTGMIGKAFVTGLQGNDPNYLKAAACAKHYAVHSGPEWNRHEFNAEVSKHDLWDTYLPAFQELVVNAKVAGVMCAYNALHGKPCCGNDTLMMEILRKKWNFTGYVTSDCGGINDFYKTHKMFPDAATASASAVLNGTDCECSGQPAYRALSKALKDGLITEEQINTSVKRLFTIRFRLGMFDPLDKVPYSNILLTALESKEHQALALKMAQQSIVLLKNENNLLPLSKNIKTIAVVGPNAADESVLLGNYNGIPSKVVSVLEGIKQKVGVYVKVIYEKGIGITDNFVFTPKYPQNEFNMDGKAGFKAEYFPDFKFNVPSITQQEKQIDYRWGEGQAVVGKLVARRIGIRWTTVYTPAKSGIVSFELKSPHQHRFYMDGELKIDNKAENSNYCTLEVTKGKSYKLTVEYELWGENSEIIFNIGSIERNTSKAIADKVKNADVIVFVGGISPRYEGEEMKVKAEGFKGGDRTSIALPKIQTELLKELKNTGKPIVFVMMTGSALGIEWESQNIPAIVNMWYAGQAGGTAIADVLFGDYNPAGRLPVTFYKNDSDLPDFEDYSMENRTYRYFKETPQYGFGYGLSYTTFAYSNLQAIKDNSNGNIMVTTDVKNSGKVDGDEVVQLYVSHPESKFKTAIQALKGFERIHLLKGESKTIRMTLSPDDLSIINANGEKVKLSSAIKISIGGSQPTEEALKSKNVITTIFKYY